jgi:hypothetical protein
VGELQETGVRGSSENKLICVGADGASYEFLWRVTKDQFEDKWIFRVETEANCNTGRSFELTAVASDDDLNTVRIVMMHHYDQDEYKAKGIPDALLPVVKRELGMSVESSPRQGATTDIYRTDAATAVWDRLVGKGLATYAADRDVYVLR